MAGTVAAVSLTATSCKCANSESAIVFPTVISAVRSSSGCTQGARVLEVSGRIGRQFAPRSHLNLQQGLRWGRKQENALGLGNVAGFWQRTSGSGRIMIKAMAEDSPESSVTTEDRAPSPEEEEDQANIREILRVCFVLQSYKRCWQVMFV